MGLIIAGERSGVGKTTVTLTLLASLCQRYGKGQVQSFKVGPDYIDPMFHRYVTGLPCRNLDPVLTSETYVKNCFENHCHGRDYAVVEGVMGLFDGIPTPKEYEHSINNFASTAHIARLLKLPILLVIDCSRLSGSVAAIAHGYSTLDPSLQIAGVVLNRVGSDRHLSLVKNALEALKIEILGVIRRQDDITIPDRHLGLVPTDELPELNAVMAKLAELGNSCFNWEKLLPLLQNSVAPIENMTPEYQSMPKFRVAVARDRAFNFYYQDNLDLLTKFGAELVFWSPLTDKELPVNIQGMYFGGGFPEVFAQQLAQNFSAIASVKQAIIQGVPTIAECGGLMYLCEEIIDFQENSWQMVGILPTKAMMGKGLTLGYRQAVTLQASLLFDQGDISYGHEFHRSHLISVNHSPLFQTYRADTDEFTGYEGWSLADNLHASYIHQHWGAAIKIPQRFIAAISNYHHNQAATITNRRNS
ncbi:cobyrinate a,c-diamide synthase [Calothrix sp. 336/3]|uniref:cobyrinate a,c-diamide synthase n=1 Tax=Calothrix sp. 336/3 TaxID=1337936 RepID=UPI0004E2B7A4|nr:cobyrinate a,c-diamide synthase [Calothrix sp. 336/3]AKG24309.1 cobyrinic acid a,c-diamide synthase [Calothrix sp. 336/3]